MACGWRKMRAKFGFAFSWVCGDLWFLAELFVSPDRQGRGIGHELLKRTLDHAQRRVPRNTALITFTFNTVSQGLYIRHGLFHAFRSTISMSPARPLAGRCKARDCAANASRPPLHICI